MPAKSRFRRLVFVCAGNICRSPLAEQLFRQRCRVNGTRWHTTSAGLIAIPGDRPNPLTLALARRAGLDLSQHRARLLVSRQLRETDLVMVMEPEQRSVILAAHPPGPPEVRLLASFADRGETIVDPGDGPESGYTTCLEHIQQCVDELARWLLDKPR